MSADGSPADLDLTALAGATIVFDLDGTLADTAPDLLAALNVALAVDGFPPADIADARVMVGRGARVLITKALAHHGTAYPQGEVGRLLAAFLDHYRNNICVHGGLYPGAERVLDALSAAGVRMAIATNKPQHLAEALIEALGVTHHFDAIIGGDTAVRKKPCRDHIDAATGRSGRAIMIGDTIVDVAAAKAAQIPVIVVRHGYSAAPPETLHADAIAEGFVDLPALMVALAPRDATTLSAQV